MTRPASAPARRTPVQVVGELLSAKQVGAFHHLTVVADGIAERTRPGAFVAVAVNREVALLRRAFWIHRVRASGAYGGSVEIVVDVRGPGTARLAELRPHDPVDIIGPLGRPFALPKEPVPCVLVGVEYASAPMFPLAERLRDRGCAVHMLLGARTEDRLFGALEARRLAKSVTVTTGDGSVGISGTVLDPLPGLLERTGAAVVYAAGPNPALAGVAALAREHGAWSQCAVEVPTACGTGMCSSCAVPVTGDDGVTRTVRACVEGPVLRGDHVEWTELAGG